MIPFSGTRSGTPHKTAWLHTSTWWWLLGQLFVMSGISPQWPGCPTKTPSILPTESRLKLPNRVDSSISCGNLFLHYMLGVCFDGQSLHFRISNFQKNTVKSKWVKFQAKWVKLIKFLVKLVKFIIKWVKFIVKLVKFHAKLAKVYTLIVKTPSVSYSRYLPNIHLFLGMETWKEEVWNQNGKLSNKKPFLSRWRWNNQLWCYKYYSYDIFCQISNLIMLIMMTFVVPLSSCFLNTLYATATVWDDFLFYPENIFFPLLLKNDTRRTFYASLGKFQVELV